METELAAARHGCKVCGKSFSSGRSLGGHMRSHHLPIGEAAAAAAEGGDDADELVARASANSGRSSDGAVAYGLRENPRKTRRLSDFADDEVEGGGDDDGERKACRVCGKLFPSWRSLFGHMRGHASRGRDRDDEEEDVDVEEEEGFVPEAPEAEEAEMAVAAMEAPAAVPALAAAPRRRRRTMRVAAPPPAPPPAAAVPCGLKEPEDVALCLLMLSRDTGRLWSSPVVKQELFESPKKPSRLPISGHAGNPDGDGDAKIKGRVVPTGRSRKRSSPGTQQQRDAAAPKRTRYECPGCGKVFGSYQALGGHRASHKRINTSCSAPKVSPAAAAAPEPSAETYASSSTLSPSASPDSVAIGFCKLRAVEKFECSVCFMVFSSGKALDGHKLSHLVPAGGGELYAGGPDQEHEQHSGGFLDLNFPPAPPEEA